MASFRSGIIIKARSGELISERVELLFRLFFFDRGDELLDLVCAEEARAFLGDDCDLEVLLGVVHDLAEGLGQQARALDHAEFFLEVLLQVVHDCLVVLAG